jgi:hypothetical protein
MAKENGVTIISFPPHCSHKLQPLDQFWSVFGPLKKQVNSACDQFMKETPNRTMNIYDIPMIVKSALPRAIQNENIVAGFRCTGIMPFNPAVFQEWEFLPSFVSDRPV